MVMHTFCVERLNLVLARGTRQELRAIASRMKMREAEVARDLLARAIETEREAEFVRRVKAAQTPAVTAAMLEVMAKLDGIESRK